MGAKAEGAGLFLFCQDSAILVDGEGGEGFSPSEDLGVRVGPAGRSGCIEGGVNLARGPKKALRAS